MPLKKAPLQQNITTQTGKASQTWYLWFTNVVNLMSNIRDDKSIEPALLSDGDAVNNSIYYSTTQSKLVYKDALGVVNDLY